MSIATNAETASSHQAQLGRSLRSRHVQMIAIGGIIGAGLFVGSSTTIATAGPAVIITYAISGLMVLMIMRMLSEMAMTAPGTGSFTEFVPFRRATFHAALWQSTVQKTAIPSCR